MLTVSPLVVGSTYHLYWSQDNECTSDPASGEGPFHALDGMHAVLENVIGEVGAVSLTHAPTTVVLSRAYDDPVVFAQPPSYNGGDTAVTRITEVSPDRFTVFAHEAPDRDGAHTAESVSWIVLEAGSWQLADGTRLEVGRLNTSATVGKAVADQWAAITFDTALGATPAVLTQVQSDNDPTWVKTRQRAAGASGFEVALEEAEAGDLHGSESVGWLAIEPASGSWNGHAYVAANTPDAVNHNFYTAGFGLNLGADPRFVASLATHDGRDGAALRHRNLTASSAQIKVEEDTTLDSETGHTPEVVSYLAIGGDGTLTGQPFAAAVHLPPTADFSYICTDLECSFDAGLSSDDQPIPSGGYAWSFGDGATGSGRTVSHTYAAGGAYTVTLTVTDSGGKSGTKARSVSVSAGGPTCAGLTQEAESGALTGFAVLSDGTASSGQYIEVANGTGNQNTPNEGFKATYCFDVPEAGTYRIKGWARSPSFGADSFFVRVDGAPSGGYNWVTRPVGQSGFLEDEVNDFGVEDPVEVSLSAGQHTVTVYQREDGTQLDRLELELQVPPSCGPLAFEAEDGTLTGFSAVDDGVASNGKYIEVPNGAGNQNSPNEGFKATYCFGVTTAGTYRIKGWARSASFGDDSFFVKVDGAPTGGYLWVPRPLATPDFQEDFVNDFNVEDPVEVFLAPGNHTLTVYQREDGTHLDRLQIELR